MGILITFRLMFHDNENKINHRKMKSTLAKITFNNDTSSMITTKFMIPDNMESFKDDVESLSKQIRVSNKLSTGNGSAILSHDFSGHGFDVSTFGLNEKLFNKPDQKTVNKDPTVHSRSKRQVPCERGEELDEYVDSLFRFASRLIRAMEPFSGLLPNVTAELPEYNVIIFLHSGGATNAYTIQRKKPAWVLCQNDSISLGLTVGFEELRVMYKFRVIQDYKLLFDGELEAQILKPKAQVQFTQTTPDEDSEEAVQQRIDALRIWSIGQVRIMVKGLGNLTQAISMFLTGFINRNLDNFMPQIRNLESTAIDFANDMLQNISIPFFSII